jgi:hypothetical protein
MNPTTLGVDPSVCTAWEVALPDRRERVPWRDAGGSQPRGIPVRNGPAALRADHPGRISPSATAPADHAARPLGVTGMLG